MHDKSHGDDSKYHVNEAEAEKDVIQDSHDQVQISRLPWCIHANHTAAKYVDSDNKIIVIGTVEKMSDAHT
jgi:hypothetical protein